MTRTAAIGGRNFEVHTFGVRRDTMTKDTMSFHGIAIDEQMALSDDPVRVLSEVEKSDREIEEAGMVAEVRGRTYRVEGVEALNEMRRVYSRRRAQARSRNERRLCRPLVGSAFPAWLPSAGKGTLLMKAANQPPALRTRRARRRFSTFACASPMTLPPMSRSVSRTRRPARRSSRTSGSRPLTARRP